MSATLQWLGHGAWLIENVGQRILLDPFLTGNPSAINSSEDFNNIDYILVSHGHADHVGDTQSIAQRCESTVIAPVEVACWLEGKGVQKTVGMNLGGTLKLPFGSIQMVPALHSSSMPDGSYGGNPAGFVLTINDMKIYFACDTALFGDMHLIGQKGIEIAILPIGDHYTMGPEDCIEAIKLIKPRRVIPAHYNTWPPIAQDAIAWSHRVIHETGTLPTVPQVGGIVEV